MWSCTTYLLPYSMEQSPFWEANGFQLVKKFPAFYGTRRFITAFTSAHHRSLSRASSIQSITPHHTSWRSILILSYHLRLGLPSGLLEDPGVDRRIILGWIFNHYFLCMLLWHGQDKFYLLEQYANNIGVDCIWVSDHESLEYILVAERLSTSNILQIMLVMRTWRSWWDCE